MKPITITFIVAAAHRIAVSVIFWEGFGLAMRAFTSNSPVIFLSRPLMRFAELMDFPVFAMGYLAFRAKHGYFPQEGIFGFYPYELSFRFGWCLVWSLCVGSVVGLMVALYRRRKYGPQTPQYWKSGL